MPFRFRKSIKVAPGVKINLGKRGASLTTGVKGFHVTTGHGQTRTTAGLPGSGMSYTHVSKRQTSQQFQPFPQPAKANRPMPNKRLLIITAIATFILLGGCALGFALLSNQNNQGSSPDLWPTIQSFSGNGNLKTTVFSVPGDWLVSWGCNPEALPNTASYPIQVAVYGSDGSLIDAHAVNDTCSDHNRSNDGNEEHHNGKVYLVITCPGQWDVEILAPQ